LMIAFYLKVWAIFIFLSFFCLFMLLSMGLFMLFGMDFFSHAFCMDIYFLA
jgi:hypothetical protein